MIDYQKIACAMRQCKFNTDDCNVCAINAECKKRRHFIEDYAADIIEELLTENEKLKKLYLRAETDATNLTGELATVYAERDAAIADIKAMARRLPIACNWCAFEVLNDPNCLECDRLTDQGKMNAYFEWRGVQR